MAARAMVLVVGTAVWALAMVGAWSLIHPPPPATAICGRYTLLPQ